MMLVVIAEYIPPAVRGRMKLWFVEVKPNTFVSGIKDHTANKVVEYLFEHCPVASGLTVFQQTRVAPGYSIRTMGEPQRKLVFFSGLPLVEEKNFHDSMEKKS
jgi:CRISPR-associated protein Cas2